MEPKSLRVSFFAFSLIYFVFLGCISMREVYCPYESLISDFHVKFINLVVGSDSLEVYAAGSKSFGDVQKISVQFVCEIQVSLEEARRLIVKHSELYLKLINSDKAIRPYLHHYPCDGNDLDLAIHFDGYEGQGSPGCIATVQAHDGKLLYRYVNEMRILKNADFTESYDEAVKIANGGIAAP
jgi:hypothetical protein